MRVAERVEHDLRQIQLTLMDMAAAATSGSRDETVAMAAAQDIQAAVYLLARNRRAP